VDESRARVPGKASDADDRRGVAAGSRSAARMAVGRYGEDVAVRYLQDAGYEVLERNWRCDLGELDIVARERDAIVVCEVKTRRSATYGPPQEAVTRVKLARLRRLAVRWLLERDVHPRDLRVDVLAVTCARSGRAVVEHLRGVA
jgi:putative endonuclease